ncbi:MAG: class I SAM-dependent methyltransferase [Alphaproteobacteria bacterium]|nr:class I SAM-dependent methyltransferase [Alphaproteobacteria bacterium]
MNYIEINKKAYDILAPFYEEQQRQADAADHGGLFKLVPKLLKNGRMLGFHEIDASNYRKEILFTDLIAGQPKNPKMLDIGVAIGYVMRYFADMGYKTTGVDLSSRMCEVAGKISPESEIFPGNIFDRDFPAEQFDVITMMSLLCQLPIEDARELLERVKTWLKPTGCIYVSTSVEKNKKSGIFSKKTLGFSKLKDQKIQRFRTNYTLEAFIDLIESSGFEILMPFLIKDKSKTNRVFQGYICRVKS